MPLNRENESEAMTTPWKRHVRIGDCDLYLGDCLEVMPALGKVDAVVACKRVQQAYDQPDLFVEKPTPPTQEGFEL